MLKSGGKPPRPLARRARAIAVVTGALAGGLVPRAVRAQQVTEIESVVVTASKRETKLLDTPMSVTVLDQATLKATNADTFADFAKLVPGLTYTDSGPGNKRYALRGLQSAGEPEVALYYDEIPISGLPGGALDTGDSQPDIKLWDVDRVEVLSGPQGTLYGNGSMGGAIRIISERPQLDSYDAATLASVGATSGGDPSYRLNGMVNLPVINNRLALRLTAYYRDEGGWVDDRPQSNIALPQIDKDNINWEHTWGGRASLSFQVTPQWNIIGIYYSQDTHTGNGSDLYPAFATGDDRYVSKAYVLTPWRDKSAMYNVISTDELSWSTFTATGSYQRRTLDRNLDTTRFLLTQFGCSEFTVNQGCTAPAILPADGFSYETVEAWSGEARLVSKTPGPFAWTLGAFLQTSTTTRISDVAKTDEDGLVTFNPLTGTANGQLFSRTNRDTFDQYALFGEGAYNLTPQLTATVGLRWFNSKRTDQQVILQQFFPGQPTGPEPFQTFTQDKLFQKYELSYKLGPQGLVYVQAAQGFRAGGPNVPGGFTVSAPPYQADSVWDYEVGWKLNLANGRVYWTGDVFNIDWSNLQELVPTAPFAHIANAGRARSDGFETAVAYSPLDYLTVNGGLTYTDARLVGAQPLQVDPTVQQFDGDRLANVPTWTVNGSIAYSRPIGNFTGTARLDGTYQSDKHDVVPTESRAFFVVGPSALFDLHLGLDSNAKWRIALDVTNLFDRYAPQSGKALDSNLVQTETAARPRTVSLSLALTY